MGIVPRKIIFRLLLFTGTRLLQRRNDGIGLQAKLQCFDQFAVARDIDRRLHGGLEDMIHLQAQFHPSEGTGKSRVSPRHRLKLHLGGIDIRCAQQNHKIVFPVLFRKFFDSTLNLKVHRAGGGSNEALGRRVDDLSAQILNGLLDGRSGHAVALA